MRGASLLFLGFAVLALPCCARMVETRTETIIARDPGRRVDAWHPERDRIDLAVRVEGDALAVRVARTRPCTLALGERRKIVTRVERSADTAGVVLEGIGAAALLGAGAAEANSDYMPGLGAIPLTVGVALGVGFVADLAAGSKKTSERTEIVQTGVQEEPACEQGPAAGAVVSFAIAGGPTLSCPCAQDGTCRVVVPESLWQAADDTLTVDTFVDGRPIGREQVKRVAR